jgi:two-component system, LytTR family, sensor kinase
MPNFFKSRIWIVYLSGWICITIFQYFSMVTFLGWGKPVAMADSLVYNAVYSLVGVGIWYTIRFPGNYGNSFVSLLIFHAISSVLVVIIWLSASETILEGMSIVEPVSKSIQRGIRLPEGFTMYFLLVAVFTLVINVRELNERIQREANLTAMLRDAEVNMLRSQIKPHFLFNSLNSISSLTLSNPVLAQEMVIKLSEFMRYSINFPESAVSTLEKELNHCDLYLEIEKVRFSDKLTIENKYDNVCLGWQMPAMILQPLVENAIKHGVYESQAQSVIRMKASCDESFLSISIGNSYDADSPAPKGTGTGINNIMKRLETVYNRHDLLTIVKTESYFEVMLKIPKSMGKKV